MERGTIEPIRGRGAVDNPTGRFEADRTLPFDDGWGTEVEPAGIDLRLPTHITPEVTRRALTRNQSPDLGFNQSVNPYKGCEHGCVYCFARPTHAYLGLSPGLDFETRIVSKPDAPIRLRDELRRASYRPETVALGTNTDPYQPAERMLEITRGLLEVLAEFRHPVTIVTKSALVLRDLDILTDLASQNLVRVYLSVTTLDSELARRMEPRAAAPRRRIDALRSLAEAGVPAGVLAAPMIPGLNDAELEGILRAAKEAGATRAGYILLRLPLEVRGLFENWLKAHYPLRAGHVLELIRDTRGGNLNDPRFGSRMKGQGAYARMLQRRFEVAKKRLDYPVSTAELDSSRFRIPAGDGRQLALFGDSERSPVTALPSPSPGGRGRLQVLASRAEPALARSAPTARSGPGSDEPSPPSAA